MDSFSSSSICQHPVLLKSLTNYQKASIKGHLVDSNNKFYGIFPFFFLLHSELFLGFRIIDNFSDCFSFNLNNKEKNNKIRLLQLDNMVIELSLSLSTAIVVMDASIKNDITTSISHVHLSNHSVTKTIYHVAFVTSTEAELFAIRYGISQVCIKENMSKIIVVTDSIHAAKKIFDVSSHPYQSYIVAILSELHHFFAINQSNSIEFWKCSSRLN